MIKKSMRTMLGVTLLEIMLVLAIAAMVIVLSIKYYQSAASSSQTNAIMGAFQSITAASDNLAQGTLTGYSGITNGTLTAILPSSTFVSPWGQTMTYAGTTSSFTVAVPSPPAPVCALITAKLSNDVHTSGSTCSSGALTYKYIANP
jgi:Tfp pilus assembly major pilin PilA